MKKHRKISDSVNKKISSRNLLNILLNTKKFLHNNSNFIKKTDETEESDILLVRKNASNEFPVMPSSQKKTPFEITRNIQFANPTIINRKSLNSLLFNSMSFDHFLKEITESKMLGNSRDLLPPISQEEKKDSINGNNMDYSLTNIINNSRKNSRNNKFNNNNKKYLFCLQTLDNMDLNHRYNFMNPNKFINENNKEEKYNISRNIIFRDIILNENSYNDLYNDNTQFLMDTHYYNDFIISKINEFRIKIPSEENLHRTLEKTYEDSEYNKPVLTLNSLSISFSCKGKYHLIHVPFEFLPIFYYQNMKHLKILLISIIRFDNDYEEISIDYDEIIQIISSSKQFELKDNANKNNNRNSRNNNKFLSKAMLLKSTKIVRKNMNNLTTNFGRTISNEISLKRENKLRQSIKKDNNTIRIFNGVKTNPKAINSSTEEKNYKNPYNKFIFKWITPKYEYDVEIKVPEAILKIGRTSLRAFVDIEYIFYLIENDYENWDFYISQFIFSYKECLYYLNEIISLKNRRKTTIIKSNSQPLFDNINTVDRKQGNNLINRNIFLNMEKNLKISDKSKIYEFFYTDKNNSNYIKIFHNFFITARCKSFKKRNKFIFDFNFSQMRLLNKISRIQGLNHFIKKLIYIDKFSSDLKFGYDELNTMFHGEYKILEKHNPNQDSFQTCLRMKEIYKDIINITITFPFVETIRYNDQNNQDCFESDYNNVVSNGIPLDVLEVICNKGFSEWPKILINTK